MKSSTASWTVTVATAALLALPGALAAQTPPATQPPATAQPATQPPANTAQATPADHLRQAKAALDDVGTANLSARARAQVAELKKRLNALERSIAANDSASATGAANRSARGARGSVNWGTEVAAMDKTLTALLGPSMPTTGTPGATATTGNKAAAAVTLDDATRIKLTEFRTHLTAFAAAMAGQQPPAGETAPATTPPGAMASTSDPAPATTPPAADAASPKADHEGARRHLTEARNVLSQLTQLPAAAQLSGEARTHMSQLISNFNELITTQSEWRAVYGKVAANLTALLGPDTGATEPPAASGAVGTSGSGMNLDPAVRAKLIEMRNKLAEFERAAGGGAPATGSASAPAATPTTSPKAAAAPPEPPGPPAAMAPTPATTAPVPSASSEPLRHVTAIETLFKSQNESGGVTLDKAQLELLRTHIAELRKLLEQAKK